MTEPCLRVTDLHVMYDLGSSGFGRRRRLHAVNGASFQIAPGETLGLVGESGSGKSTIGLSIMRLIEPWSGQVQLGGTDVTGVSRKDVRTLRRRMQMVFQDPYSSLNPSMTVAQLLEEPLIIHRDLPKSERSAMVGQMLESVGLHAGYAVRYPHEFSGGQRQRIAIARAMILHPELVVLDEPVSALDVSTQSQILNLLKAIQGKSGTAFLLVAHDLSVVRLMSPNVAPIHRGADLRRAVSRPGAAANRDPYHPSRRSSQPVESAQRLPFSHAMPVRDGYLHNGGTSRGRGEGRGHGRVPFACAWPEAGRRIIAAVYTRADGGRGLNCPQRQNQQQHGIQRH